MKKWHIASAVISAIVITPVTANAYTFIEGKQDVQTIDIQKDGDARIITFSEAVNRESITSDNIRLYDVTLNIPVTIAIDVDGQEVSLTLVNEQYKENHQYELFIENTIQNMNNEPLAEKVKYVYKTINTGEETETDNPPIEQEKPEVPEITPTEPELTPETPEVKPVEPEPTPETPEVKPVEPEPTPETPEVTPVEPELTPETPEVTPVEPELTPETPEVKPVEPEPTPETPEVTPVEPELKPENPLSYKNEADVLRSYDMGNDITYYVMKHDDALSYEVQITISDELVGGYYAVNGGTLYDYTIGTQNPATVTHNQFKLIPLIDTLNDHTLLGFTYEAKHYADQTKLREAMQLHTSENLLQVSQVYADLANQFRAQYSKAPLTVHNVLTEAAKNHSADMAMNNYFNHTSLDGKEPWDRVNAVQPLGTNYVGENISPGRDSIFEIHVLWVNSKGHRENILRDEYTHIGYGSHYKMDSDYKHYSTTKFIKLPEEVIPTEPEEKPEVKPVEPEPTPETPEVKPVEPELNPENPLSYKNEADVLRRYDMGNDITYYVMKHDGAANYEVQITIGDELVGGYFGVEGKQLFGHTIGEQKPALVENKFVTSTYDKYRITELTDTSDGNKLLGISYELKNYADQTKLREAMQLHTSENLLQVSQVYADLANEFRAQHGLAPLAPHDVLAQAAKNHSVDMATNNYFSHTSLNGQKVKDRINAVKPMSETYIAENISAGRRSIFETHMGWIISDGHRNNLLNINYTHIGYGTAYNSSSKYGMYSTTTFMKANN